MAALCLAVLTLGVLCPEADAQSGPSVSSAYQELHQRAVANATNFYVYRDQDSGLNHGYPSGWFGTISAISIDTGCIDNPADTVTGCYPSSNTTALDLTRGTAFRLTFAPMSGDEYAGVNIEEPLNWGADGQPASNSYNLTGATAVSLDVRSPNSAKVQFGVGGCVTNFLTIGPSWTTMTFLISSLVPPPPPPTVTCPPNLSDTHILFTITTNSTNDPSPGPGATVLVDNIQFTPNPTRSNQGSETLSLPLGTKTFGAVPQTQTPFPPDQANRNIAAIYEAALSLIGFLARGTPQDLADAQTIANALDYALHNDNQGDLLPVAPGGFAGLHNAYSSGDIALLNGQTTGALAGNVRLAGFTCGSASPTGFCLELDGATGGNDAFAVLSLVAAYRQFGNATYLSDALEIANWIVGNLQDQTGTGFGGYFYGYPDEGLPKVLGTNKSIENNADVFAAFSALAAVESQLGNTSAASTWTTNAQVAGNFVLALYDSDDGRFYNGTVPVGTASGPGVCPTGPQRGNDVITVCDFLDSNTFTTLAMAGSGTYKNSIDWTQPINYVSTVYPQTISANGLTFQGVDIIPPPPAGIAWEFTGQFIETCQYIAALLSTSTCGTLAQNDLTQIGQAQASAPFADGMGVVAATINGESAPPSNLPPLDECLDTPFQCIPERVGLAATVWAILASENLNVFWPFPGANTSPGSLTFTGQQVGTPSAAQTVTLSNTGSVSLAISSISVTGTNSSDFGVTNTCGANLAAGANCTISVTLTPTATGTRNGTIAITDNAPISPQTVTLTGTGVAAGNFTLSASPTSNTVTAGNSATYTLTVTPTNGFNQAVTFACSGLPSGATCSFAPPNVTPNGSAGTTTLTVATATTSAQFLIPGSRLPQAPFPTPWVWVAGLALVVPWRRIKSQRRLACCLPILLLVMLAGLVACGGGSGSATSSSNSSTGTPTTSTITVTGTSGSGSSAISNTVSVSITIDPS
ncbi:MAG: choice-of-anchor D domain-containing protein [Terriglobia bacterium]